MPEVDLAARWLHQQVDRRQTWVEHGDADAVQSSEGAGIAGVDALYAAGALTAGEAAQWRDHLQGRGQLASSATRAQIDRATALLDELLDDVQPGLDDDGREGASQQRFEGALAVCAAIGAVDATEWDARLRRRLGEPTAEEELALLRDLNAGGTQADLQEVIPGPPDRCAGFRLLFVLRFTDALVVVFDKQDVREQHVWLDWTVRDDCGTAFSPTSSGGSEHDETVTFRAAPPPEATWLEVASGDVARFRVAL